MVARRTKGRALPVAKRVFDVGRRCLAIVLRVAPYFTGPKDTERAGVGLEEGDA
jgi:hypothetical protein